MRNSSLALIALPLLATACAEAPEAPPAITHEQAETEVWELEQAIYAARGQGSLDPYINATAPDYQAWPPGFPVPTDADDLRQAKDAMAATNNEQLAMTYVSLALDGDTAVIYYRTHRTMRPDGEEVDEHFNVTHTWVHRDGEWQILGGMARPAAAPPADATEE